MTTSTQCPICELDNCEKTEDHLHDQVHFNCCRCGKFRLTGTLDASIQSYIKSQDDRWKLSHWLRNAESKNQEQFLDTSNIKPILERRLPSLAEQSDLLLKWLAEQSEDFGKPAIVTPDYDFVTIGARSVEGFRFVLTTLISRNWLSIINIPTVTVYRRGLSAVNNPPESSNIKIEALGWEQIEQLQHNQPSYRKAFMAMKFNNPELDQIVGDYFKPATAEAGFELLRLDDHKAAGLIDNKMRVEIRNADFVIADLSHDNLGAYWEAGYAEGLGKPVIYTCKKEKFAEKSTHFDTNHHLTIQWDPEDPAKAAEELKATIRATLPHLAKLQ
jgi:hypothetical protein